MGKKIRIEDLSSKHRLYNKALEFREKLICNLGDYDDTIAVYYVKIHRINILQTSQ